MNLDNNLTTVKQQNYSCAKAQAVIINPNSSKNALRLAKLNTKGLNFGKNNFPNYIIFKGMPQAVKFKEGFKVANADINQDGGFKIKYFLNDEKNFEIEYNINFICSAQKFIKEKCGRDLTKYDLLNLDVCPTKIPSEMIENALASLKTDNPEKYQTVKRILNSTFIYSKTKQGISEDYIQKFIEKLSQCNDVLLKNLIDNNIPIKIYDDLVLHKGASHASYSHTKRQISNIDGVKNYVLDNRNRCLIFTQNCAGEAITINGEKIDSYESLPHELAHAFDYNNGQKLNLTKQDFVSIINGENYSRFANLPSFSKEFDNALTKDILNMFEIDKQSKIPEGQTFKSLLENKHFNYYLGTFGDIKTHSFSDVIARKELFAQFISYVTSGEVTDEVFQSKIKELFPNCIDFVKNIMELAKSI